MLWTPHGANDLTWQKSNVEGVRPSGAFGTSITPGNNIKGSYSAILATLDLLYDVYGVLINFNSGATSAAARDIIVDIGVDPAGGSSYSVLIPDLLASCAASLSLSYGINYYFPIWIKAGSSIGARSSVTNATVGTLRCTVTVFGRPRDPKVVKVGTYCTAFGITSASSSGTAITSGTTSDGSNTTIATSIARDHWAWQVGMGINDTTMTAGGVYAVDLVSGDASNKVGIIRDQPFFVVGAAEALATPGLLESGERLVKAGSNLYGRMQCSGTADSGLSIAAYGVGG